MSGKGSLRLEPDPGGGSEISLGLGLRGSTLGGGWKESRWKYLDPLNSLRSYLDGPKLNVGFLLNMDLPDPAADPPDPLVYTGSSLDPALL